MASGMDPWANYNATMGSASTFGSASGPTLSTSTNCPTAPAASSNSGGDASGRTPQMFSQHMFHPGFSMPTGNFGVRPQSSAFNQQNVGFSANAFASALGHGTPAPQGPAPRFQHLIYWEMHDRMHRLHSTQGAQCLLPLREIRMC